MKKLTLMTLLSLLIETVRSPRLKRLQLPRLAQNVTYDYRSTADVPRHSSSIPQQVIGIATDPLLEVHATLLSLLIMYLAIMHAALEAPVYASITFLRAVYTFLPRRPSRGATPSLQNARVPVLQ